MNTDLVSGVLVTRFFTLRTHVATLMDTRLYLAAYLSFLESMSPYPLQQVAEGGYVSVLLNSGLTLSTAP